MFGPNINKTIIWPLFLVRQSKNMCGAQIVRKGEWIKIEIQQIKINKLALFGVRQSKHMCEAQAMPKSAQNTDAPVRVFKVVRFPYNFVVQIELFLHRWGVVHGGRNFRRLANKTMGEWINSELWQKMTASSPNTECSPHRRCGMAIVSWGCVWKCSGGVRVFKFCLPAPLNYDKKFSFSI